MDPQSATLIYFSPTGTTKKIVESIVKGMGMKRPELIDLTRPEAATKSFEPPAGLAVIGSPVYAGRVPADMIARLQRAKGNKTPALIVVVYGNRAYEDALVELRDAAVQAGFKPIAAAAFIGEHSYSTEGMPVAAGRPDQADMAKAEAFGRDVIAKLRKARTIEETATPAVPGNVPYKERAGLANVAPEIDLGKCTLCGTCVAVCPKAAVTMAETVRIDAGTCIRCCACIKNCPSAALSMEDPCIKQIAVNLSTNCRARKEPETYL